jgi:hypothetical protein
MVGKASVTSAVVLQVLRWIRRSPEDFLAGRPERSSDDEHLPDAGPGQILRFDTRSIYEALHVKGQRRGMTWKEVARELPGFTRRGSQHI